METIVIPFETTTEMFDNNMIDIGKKEIAFWSDRDHEETLTYSDLNLQGKKIASVLKDMGVEKGEALLMQLPTPGMYARVFWGLQYAGAVPMALPFAFADNAGREVLEKELNICKFMEKLRIVIPGNYLKAYENVVSDYTNVQLLVYEEIIEKANQAVPFQQTNISRDDTCCVLFSSGSTDVPKGVVITHDTMMASIYGAIDVIHYSPEDVFLSWLPMTHAFGFIGFHLLPIAIGAVQMIMPPPVFVQNPKWFLHLVSNRNVTVFGAMNFALSLFDNCFSDEEIHRLSLKKMKHLFLGGEPVNPEIADHFLNRFSDARLSPNVLRPIYGMSESAFAVSVAKSDQRFRIDRIDSKIMAEEKRAVSIENNNEANLYASVGYPVTGLQLIVVDENGNVLPEGYIGEFCYKGRCISNQYYFAENEESKKMVGDYLASGDMGYVSKGEIILTGRKKDLIIINGQNYYPTDVESMIGRLEERYKGKVLANQVYDNKNNPELILFVEDQQDLETFVKEMKMLDQKIKRVQFLPFKYYLPVTEIPRTSNGKIKRAALSDQFKRGEFDEIIRKIRIILKDNHENIVYENENDKALQSLWDEIVRERGKNSSANFFEAGGDSVKLLQLSVRLKEDFGLRIGLQKLIKAVDVESFVDLCHQEMDLKEKTEKICVEPDGLNRNQPFELTDIQRAYLLGRNDIYDMGGISTHGYYEYETDIDIGRFEQALNKVIANQDNLRLVMTEDLKQRILEEVPWYKIKVIDCKNDPQEQKESLIIEERRRMSHAIFDPFTWPLFEFEFIELSNDRQILLMGIDLLITDASSIQMLKEMIMDCYHHPELELKPVEFGFRDFMTGIGKLKESAQYEEDRLFWQKRLDRIPPAPRLHLKQSTANLTNSEFARLSFSIEDERVSELKKIADSNGISLSAVVCTAFALALSMYSNQSELTLNVTVFNKYDFHPDVRRIMGDFTSTILLSFFFEKSGKIGDIFSSVQNEILSGLEHRLYSGVEVLRDIRHDQGVGNSAVMPIVFTSTLDKPFDSSNDLGKLVYAISQTSQVYLDCQARFEDGRIVVTWDYLAQLFEYKYIHAIFKLFEQIVNSFYSNQDLNDCLKLSKDDEKLWKKYNDTSKSLPCTTLIDLFERAVKEWPDKVAVKDSGSFYSYRELNSAANAVARQLIKEGVTRGTLVAIEGWKRKETVAAIMGVLKCGAAYVPLDPDNPEYRKRRILEDSGAVLISNDALDAAVIQELDESFDRPIVRPEDIAYIIYTSGSTGTPKGVVISHESAANTIQDVNLRYNVSENDHIIGLSALSFDLSVYDIFGALAAGAQLVMVEEPRNIKNVADIVVQEEITIWNSVPAFVQMYAEELKQRDTVIREEEQSEVQNSLRLIIMSGDWIPVDLPQIIKSYLKGVNVISMGGATEASIWSIYYSIEDKEDEFRKSIPYGEPLANQNFYVMGYWNDVCPVDVPGELCIGGIGLAKEYKNNPAQTEAAFYQHDLYGRLYRTGDYGVMRRDGYLEFLGRQDTQIKIRGHRIELGEIDKALLRNNEIQDALSIKKDFDTGSSGIVSFVTSEKKVNEELVKEMISEYLPEYMIPTVIIQLEKMPLTGNGKVDRKALETIQIRIEDKGRKEEKNTIEPVVKEIWENVLNLNDIGYTQNFYDIGGDSVKLFKIINDAELKMHTSFPKDMYFAFETIEEMSDILMEFSSGEIA